MTTEFILFWSQETLKTALMVTAPILIGGMTVGLAVGIFQSVTQIHEMTLSFIPKMAVVAIIILLLMPWFLNHLVDFTTNVFTQISMISK
ncbi:MAG: flagellar biosynthesis protein FliQ [bacterium]